MAERRRRLHSVIWRENGHCWLGGGDVGSILLTRLSTFSLFSNFGVFGMFLSMRLFAGRSFFGFTM